jgi:hypothetical protein
MPSMFRRPSGTARAVLALALTVAVVTVAVPAAAQPIATTSASIAKTVKRAFSLSKAANRRSAKALEIAESARKQPGPQGSQGEPGLKGDPGPQGMPGVSELERVAGQTQPDSTDSKELVVACPSGKKVFGGGAHVGALVDENNPNPQPDTVAESLAITSSLPSGAGAWSARAHEHTATDEAWTLTVYAICGNAG